MADDKPYYRSFGNRDLAMLASALLGASKSAERAVEDAATILVWLEGREGKASE